MINRLSRYILTKILPQKLEHGSEGMYVLSINNLSFQIIHHKNLLFLDKYVFDRDQNPSHWTLYADVLKIKTRIVVKQEFAKMPFVY